MFQTQQLLRDAGKQVELIRILMIAQTAPWRPADLADERWREGYCSWMLERAYDRARDRGEDYGEGSVFRYFVRHLPTRPAAAGDAIRCAIEGVLPGVWDVPRAAATGRGLLRRIAAVFKS